MPGISAIYFLNPKGKVIITRSYRACVPTNITDTFNHCVLNREDFQVKPVFASNGFIYCWIQHRDIYVVGVAVQNCNATMILVFLYHVVDVLTRYLKVLQENSLMNNFVVTYELLDEMMDAGYPQTTDTTIIREYIKNQAHRLIFKDPPKKIPSCVTDKVSWRPDGIKHKKNEVYLDVIEKLNMLISPTGTVLKGEILGFLKMKSWLSGMPELKLGLNDKILMDAYSQAHKQDTGSNETDQSCNTLKKSKMVELEDVQFHQCVRLVQFMSDRTISFIPPDGDFVLMTYRLPTKIKPLIHVESNIVEPTSTTTRLRYSIKAKTNFRSRSVATNVEIHIPVPQDADTPAFHVSMGCVKYLPDKNLMVWCIKHFPGQKEHILSANFGFPSTLQKLPSTMKKPINVLFEIPYFTVSCLTVRYLKIVEKSGYHALPWVRYITRNGDYSIRTA